jgi:hypothetical protein
MALLDDVLNGWGPSILVGVGVAVAAPVLLPVVGTVVRPVAKGVIRGALFVSDTLQELVAEGQEQLSDLVAEVQAERAVAAKPAAEPKV